MSVKMQEGSTACRPLRVALVFHANQNIVPTACVGAEACYRGLLKVLLKHPNAKFIIHVSGTLIHSLLWFDERTIDLLKEGITRDQFEILGSSYSQNILYATNDWDNHKQLAVHRELIVKTLGAQPVGFWNAERCWRQSLVPLLRSHGYRYTFVETSVFRQRGDELAQHVLRATEHDGESLLLFNDDTNFIGLVDRAISTGMSERVVEYLRGIRQLQGDEDFVVVYAQDAEATGMWQLEMGTRDPAEIADNLDKLLTELEAVPWIRLVRLDETTQEIQPAVTYRGLPDGQANWMVETLHLPETQWYKPGYGDWFTYQALSPDCVYGRELFALVRGGFAPVETAIRDYRGPSSRKSSAERLLRLAELTFVTHQYEFGCIGLDIQGSAQWELVRTTLVPLKAAEYALSPRRIVAVEDINLDGVYEVVAVTESDLFVFSLRGGRLLYWFDLDNGEELVGAQNASYYYERYQDDNQYVPDLYGGKDVYPWHKKKELMPHLYDKRYVVRRRALNDEIRVGRTTFDKLVYYPFTLAASSASSHRIGLTLHYEGASLTYDKRVEIDERGLLVTYLFPQLPDARNDKCSVSLTVENSLCPDYASCLDSGRGALAFWNGKTQSAEESASLDTTGVVNLASGTLLEVIWSDHPISLTGDEHFHALALKSMVCKEAAPDLDFTLRFSRRRVPGGFRRNPGC